MDPALSVVDAVSIAARIDGKWLLVKRAHEPAKGKFAFPGGRVEAGETLDGAARRELREETGLEAGQLTEFATLRLPGNGCVYALTVFSALSLSGTVLTGGDAADAGFHTLEEISRLPMTQSTYEAIRQLESTLPGLATPD